MRIDISNLWKQTPLFAVSAALALLVASVLLGIYGDQTAQTQKIGAVTVQARILASTVPAALEFDDHQAAQGYVNALTADPDVEAAAVYDARGELFASFANDQTPPPPEFAPARGAFFSGDRLEVVASVRQRGADIGSVYLRTVTLPLSQRLERYGLTALLVIMAALVVGVLGVAHSTLRGANDELARRAEDLAIANQDLQKQIEERERVEEALRQAQKMEAIGQLTGGVAHDFNNILQIILSNLDAMARRLRGDVIANPDELRRRVEAAAQGGERAAALTQRLLAFSRRQPLAPKPVDVNKLVRGMSDLLYRTLGEHIQIETVLAAGAWQISADINQLENALLNLAVNARDAMPEGGRLTVETSNAYLDQSYASTQQEVQPGQYVMIEVTDTGAGMSPDVLSKAFEPFFTTKDVGKGTGLGLSQVYGFIKQSGGHTKIYSDPGHGTTVKLYLPRLVTAEATAAEREEARQAPTGATGDMILVVEDEAEVRANSVQMLQELGYRVIEAENGRAALEALERAPEVKLLFTDVGLPGGINGRQLVEEARKMRPDLRILYTTGYARNAIVHNGRLDPGVELIGKPFSFAALAAKVKWVLEQEV